MQNPNFQKEVHFLWRRKNKSNGRDFPCKYWRSPINDKTGFFSFSFFFFSSRNLKELERSWREHRLFQIYLEFKLYFFSPVGTSGLIYAFVSFLCVHLHPKVVHVVSHCWELYRYTREFLDVSGWGEENEVSAEPGNSSALLCQTHQ